MEITKQTRRAAYRTRPVTRAREIVKFMGDRELTAREIAYGMGYDDLNAVKPRLSEMKEQGLVEAISKKKCKTTGKTVAVWKVIQN